jgi:hypothetical protein
MDVLGLAIALGFWPAVPVSGHWLLGPARERIASPSRAASLALAAALGVAIWSPALLLFLVAGAYSPQVMGALGWIVVAAYAARGFVGRRVVRRREERPTGRMDAWDLLLAVGVIGAGVLYVAFSGEFVIGGRDENSYALHAMWIAEHRRLDIPYPWPDSLHDTFYDAFLRFTGTFRTEPVMTPAFGHVLPVWLAQAEASFGTDGLWRLNAVFSLVATLVFYGLTRRLVGKPLAVTAALILALNPAQLWISRVPLTEVMTQLLLWAAAWLIVVAVSSGSRLAGGLAGVVLGAAVLVRIDMVVVAPLILLAHLGVSTLEDEAQRSRPMWAAVYATGALSLSLAIGYYVVFSRPYIAELLPQLLPVALVTLAALVLLVVGSRRSIRMRVGSLVRHPAALGAIGLGVAGLTVYAYFIRPIDEPFRLFGEEQVLLAGKRTFAEDALPNLAAYLSPPLVFGGIAGWFLCLWQAARTRVTFWMPLLTIAGGFSVLYLANPAVTPDHFWAVRRFVPAVIPAFIGFASIGAWQLVSTRGRAWSTALCVVALIGFGAFSLRTFAPFLTLTEHNGYRAELARLADGLPRDEMVLAINGERWWKPLYVLFGRRVVQLSLETGGGRAAFTRWTSDELAAGRRPTVLGTGTEIRLHGLRYERTMTVTLNRQMHDGVSRPPPTEISAPAVDVSIFRILGADEAFSYRGANLVRGLVWDVERAGFHDPERVGGTIVAWTDGSARISLPARGGRPAELAVSIPAASRPEAPITILVNGTAVFEGVIPPGGLHTNLSLAEVAASATVDIDIQSATRTERRDLPIDGSLYRRETVERTLGVAVELVQLSGVLAE